MTQLDLVWHDSRVPQEFIDHYVKTGTCLNCLQPLTCHVHAQRHWEKCHTKRAAGPKRPARKKSAPSPYCGYRVWKPGAQQWQVVSEEKALQLRHEGFCVARIKTYTPAAAVLQNKAA